MKPLNARWAPTFFLALGLLAVTFYCTHALALDTSDPVEAKVLSCISEEQTVTCADQDGNVLQATKENPAEFKKLKNCLGKDTSNVSYVRYASCISPISSIGNFRPDLAGEETSEYSVGITGMVKFK